MPHQKSIEIIWQCERMDEYRMARRVLMSEVSRERVWGRPMLGWTGGELKIGKSGEPWCICNWMSFTRHFCLALCSFGPPSFALMVTTWRGVGCRYMICGWDKLEKWATTENQDAGQIYVLRGVCWMIVCVCVLSDLTWLPLLCGGRKYWTNKKVLDQ